MKLNPFRYWDVEIIFNPMISPNDGILKVEGVRALTSSGAIRKVKRGSRGHMIAASVKPWM